jgi:hypothetical protein
MTAQYQIIYWCDIPVQVRGRNGRSRFRRSLSPRFQKTVHRAAFRAKAINGFDYIKEWRLSDWQEGDGDVAALMTAVAAQLENEYGNERLDQLAHNKGNDPHDNPIPNHLLA